MPYTPISDEEFQSRVMKRLGMSSTDAKDYLDPALQPGFRVKPASELPYYTRETPMQETARISREYDRAGANDLTYDQTFGFGGSGRIPRPYMNVSQAAMAIPAGVGEGLTSVASIPVDIAATAMGYGRPMSVGLNRLQDTYSEVGENPVAGFVRNVFKSVAANVAGSAGGVPGIIAVNAIPTAMQEYERGIGEGLTDGQAKARSLAYGAVSGFVSPLLEMAAPGMSKTLAGGFVQSLADDVGKPLATAIFRRMATTAASEGAEESIQEILTQYIDAATTTLTGNKNLEKPYASYTERLWDVAQAFGLGAAAGGLVQGGMEFVNRMPSTARFIAENQAELNRPAPPVQPLETQQAPEQQAASDLPQPQVSDINAMPVPNQEMQNAPQAQTAEVPIQQEGQVPPLGGAEEPTQLPAGEDLNAESPTVDIPAEGDGAPKVAGSVIREFLDSITPEQKQAIANLSVPSRQAIAEVLGVDSNRLPDAIKSERGRQAAQIVAQRDLRQPTVATPNTEALAAPGPNSQYLPTGGEAPATGSVPRPTNPNMTGPQSEVTTSLGQINRALTDFARSITGVRTPISEGVRQERGSHLYGFFDPVTGAVRMADRNSVPVLAHELSHMIDRTTDIYRSAPAQAQAEMRQVGSGMNGNYTPQQYISEGRAEFLRMYIQEGPQAAQNLAPAMYAHFTAQMQQRSPAALRALNEAAQHFGTFIRGMNAVQRQGSQIVNPDSVQSRIQRAVSSLTGIGSKAVGNFWDIAEAGRRMANKYRQWTRITTGREQSLPPERNPALMLDYLHGLAATRAKEMILEGMVNAQGERVGESLRDVLEPLGGSAETTDLFGQYLVAKRTLTIGDDQELGQFNAEMTALLGDEWTPVMPRSGPSSIADARAVVQMLEQQHPEFRQVAERYYRFFDNVLSYMAEMSPTLASAVQRIRLRDPGAYTPLMRDIKKDGKAGPIASAQSGQIGRRLTGSNRAVIEPLTQAVQIVESRLATAHQRKLLETIISLANRNGSAAFGMAEFIERLNPGEKADGPVIEVVNAQGTVDRYQINDPGVMMMLSALNPVSLEAIPVFGKAMELLFGKPSAILKTFATGINPRFALVTQPLFNVWELMAKGAAFSDRYRSRNASNVLSASVRRMANHGQLIGDWLKFWLARTIQQTGKAIGREIDGNTWADVPFLGQAMQWLDRAKREGIEFSRSIRNDDSAAYDVSREAAGVTNSAVFRNPVRVVQEDGATGLLRWMFSSIPGWVGDTLNASEYAAKAAVLKSFLEGQGLTLDSALSERQKVESARAVKESFGNYARRGATSRYLEKLSPYLTSPQVHTRSLMEAVRQDPANVIQVGMYLLIGAFLLTLKNLEDDEYREANPAQKARYVHFKSPDGGWVMLPGYSDFMTVFHGMGVVLAHLYSGADAGSQVTQTLKALGTQFVPVPSPVVPMEAASQITGKDIRTGRDIVPKYKDRRDGDVQATVVAQRPAREQYTDRTSRVARAVGYVTGLSPMRVEHALDALTARFVTDIEKVVTGKKTAVSIVTPRYREEGLLSDKDQATTDLIDELKRANEIKNDPSRKETPEERERRLMLESADAARDAYSALKRREKDDKKVSEYSRIQRQLSRTAVDMYRAGKYSHSPFKVAKRLADVELARLDGEEAEVNKLIYNGLDGLARKRPVKAYEGKTIQESVAAWQEDIDEAKSFKDGLGLTREQALDIARKHMIATKTDARLINVRLQAISRAW